MSVSDPLIKDIKACTLSFLNELNENGNKNKNVNESSPTLLHFCQIIEKIFYSKLQTTCNTLGFIKYNTPWSWLAEIAEDNHYLITFSYKNSVDGVKEQKHIVTNTGKFRLLIRHFLVNKCLHVPVQYLLCTKKYSLLYKDTTILGDEILLQILLSVLLQFANLHFQLDLKNSTFLDMSWKIPQVVKLELVPSESLGLSISFAGGKAVIVGIRSNSVIFETGDVEVGDILDNLNGVHLCSATKGKLHSILHLSKGKPISCSIIKAINTDTKEIYMPVVKLLKQVNIDPDTLKSKLHENNNETRMKDCAKKSSGFKIKYIGCIEIGNQGDVKMIDKAARNIIATYTNKNKSTGNTPKVRDTFFEIGELGVKVVDKLNSEIIFKHSYMEISSCGSVTFLNNYFAYVAGDEYCNVASKFTCYLFSTDDDDTAFTILQSIGQGFHRTHFAV